MAALRDLERPHPFAAERLGFFSCRQSLHERRPFLLCCAYHSIPDEYYVHDRSCCARINGDAIRSAMGRSFRDQCGELWIHTHGRHGRPVPSPTDRAEGPNVVRSLANAQPASVQGWAVISEEGISGQIRTLDGILHELDEIAVVGWPMKVAGFSEDLRVSEAGEITKTSSGGRYARQSFLGAHSQRIFEAAKIGIVGLGGGGSHISQQLAHIGFQRVVLCDADRAELTNLNRLIGATLQDVRKKRAKSLIAGRLFRTLQPKAEIDDRPAKWEEKRESLRDCDIILGCIDSFSGRRDLEAFCRSLLIPMVDIGMVALRPLTGHPEIYGQVIVSMPGEPCLHCVQFLTPSNLAREAEDYDGSPQPQVVWSNGALASIAVGHAIGLLTGWSGPSPAAFRIDHRGSTLTMSASHVATALQGRRCKHYPLSGAGDPRFIKL